MARGKMKKVISRKTGLLFFLMLMICSLSSCYIPGIGALPDAEDPPGAGDPMGSDDIFYGKFILYEIAGGEVRDLNGGRILYLVGDEVYYPANDPALSADYNFLRRGFEAELTFHYRDRTENSRPASKSPEGIVLDDQLTLYYSDFRMNWTASAVLENNCGVDAVGNNMGAATLIPVIGSVRGVGVEQEPLWWSLSPGSNLGGNGAPIGSISCVIALYTLKREAKISVGWGEFIKLGGAIMLVQVIGLRTPLLNC